MTQLHTEFGDFTLTRRATWGASVVEIKHGCRHRGRWWKPGEFTIIEHRKQPMFREHIGMGWSRHVATYDRTGKRVVLKG